MKNRTDNPIDSFLAWFNTIPVLHQQYMARLFFLCTTDNSADFAMSPDEALKRLQYYAAGPDFLLRRLSRLMILRTVFDLILNNRERLENLDHQLAGIVQDQKVVGLSEKQWEKTADSWRRFRSRVLTDKVIFSLL